MKRLIFILLLAACFNAKAQDATKSINGKVQDLVASLDSFKTRNPAEKVHIQFDKPYYSLGDTIWMKAYVVFSDNTLSPLSKILHVDLINDKDIIKLSYNIPLTKGLGWGAITLRDSLLQEGDYHIRAYTNWMRNAGNEYFFDKTIKIGNALSTIQKPNTAVAERANKPADISIQFFPEGGDLVNNLASKVGFKAIGTDGLSREVSGIIVDKSNKEVTSFKSEHAGMGTFMLQPTPGNIYIAVIKVNGVDKRIVLPKAKEQGYIISATQDEYNIIVNINASSGLMQNGTIALVAQGNNKVQYAAAKTFNRTAFTTTIPKIRFPEGILQLTVFSPDFQPVAERLIYIHHPDEHLDIKFIADKPEYGKRNKVHLNMAVTNQNGDPVVGAFSLAVTDETKVPFNEDDEKTIFSNLLLSSEIKGYIEQPNYYFTDATPDKTRQLDNLLITQGWRRFEWKDIMAKTFPSRFYKVETGLGISGQIMEGYEKPAVKANVFVLFNIGNGILADTVTDEKGRFKFNNFPYAKGTPFSLTASDSKGTKNLKIVLDKQLYEPPAVTHLPDEPIAVDGFTTYIENSRTRFNQLRKDGVFSKPIQLQEINIKELAVKHSASLAGAGNADQVLTFMDLLNCQNDLSLCLRAHITNVQWRPDTAGNRHMMSQGVTEYVPYSRGYDAPMMIVVDGIERPNEGLSSIMSSDVASVEVLRGGGTSTLYGLHGAGGVLVITTKTGDIDYAAFGDHRGPAKSPGMMKYSFAGYEMRRQFYSPDYFNDLTNAQQPDLRATIYWGPSIITDDAGKASVDFFNADGNGNYRVIMEGLTPDGKLGRQVYHYTVK